MAYLASALPVTSYDLLAIHIGGTPVGSGDYVPKTYNFTSTVSGGTGTNTIAWNFGDGGSASGTAPSHTYTVPGTYSVTATVTDSVSHVASSNTVNITVYGTLTVSASSTPNQLFINQPFTFNAAALGGDGVYSYSWTFTGGATATGSTANLAFTTSGTKTATVTATDGAGHSAQASVNVTVWNPLTVTASGTPLQGNKPLAVSFTAVAAGGAGGYDYAWDFGDGSTGTGAAASHTYTTDGTYFARVTVKDSANNTKVSSNVEIIVYAPMAVSLSATPTSGTLPLSVTFAAVATGGDGNYSYSYTYGDGTAASANPNHTYATAGTYSAHVVASDNAGHSVTSTNVTVTVWAPLTVSISSTSTSGLTPFAPGFTATVAGGDTHYTYLWTFGDGTTSTSATPSKTYTTAGTFSASLTVTDTASHSATSNTINITTWNALTLAISANPALLIGPGVIEFTADVAGGNGSYTVAWTFGDGGSGNGTTVNHPYAVGAKPSFTYTVTAVATDGVGGTGHTATKTLTVTVKPIPPTILTAEKLVPPQVESWRLKLMGTNFQSGCVATINGTTVTTTFKNAGEIILKNCKSLCPKNVPVTIVVTNPDGGVSANFTYVRTEMP